jgi:Fuc2NAc and GlcNAc transferase
MILPLIIILVISIVLTYLVKVLTIRKNILDNPNERSSHSTPTPRGGGIAIVVSWSLAITFLFFNKLIEKDLYFALLSAIPIAIIGILDDVLNLTPAVRTLIQIISTSLALYFLGGLKVIDLGFILIATNFTLSILAFVFIIWCINLFNFLDGIDGYLSMEIIFISTSIFLLTNDITGLFLAISTLGFLIFNWQPAKIFMGDVGSTFLGMTVIILGIYYQNTNTLSLTSWLILTTLFWYDATLTLIIRISQKEKFFIAHRKHAYQRIVRSGFSHQKTVIYASVLNIFLFTLAYLAESYSTYKLLFLALAVTISSIVYYYIGKRKAFNEK